MPSTEEFCLPHLNFICSFAPHSSYVGEDLFCLQKEEKGFEGVFCFVF
jgi:hypothetical protein